MTVFEKTHDTDIRWQPLRTPMPSSKGNKDKEKDHNKYQ